MRRLVIVILLLGFCIDRFGFPVFGSSVLTHDEFVRESTVLGPLENPSSDMLNAPRVTDYFVDAVNGSNATGDGSIGAPWKTITYALSQIAGTGLQIHVAAGTYDQALGESFPIVMKSGISVTGAGYTTTILSGIASTQVVNFVGTTAYATTTVLSGLKIMGGVDGVWIEGISGIGTAPTIQNNWIVSNTHGIFNQSLNGEKIYAVIRNNLISNNSQNGIYNYASRVVAEVSPLIIDNTITQNGGDGINCYGTGSAPVYNNDYAVCSPTITHNFIANNLGNGFTCISYGAGECNSVFDRNTIANNVGWGIGRRIDFNYLAPIAPKFYNNFIVGNAGGGANFSDQTDSYGDYDGPLFVNNTIAYNGLYGIIGGYPTIVNNIVWGQTSDLNASVDRVTYSDVSQGIYAGTNYNISKNPLFINPSLLDYHISSISPVVNQGNCTYPGLPSTDIDGDPRVIGPCVDMGADEVTTYWDTSQQSVDHTVALPGQTLAYTLNITNTSNIGATGVVITDILDSRVSFLSASSGGLYSNGVVVWNGLTIPANTSVALSLTVAITFPVTNTTTIVNRVQVRDSVPTFFELPTCSTVVNAAVHAAFSATPLSGAVPLVVTFSNQSSNATQAFWTYGDGVTSTVTTTHTHTYNSPGTFTVTLQASNPVSSDTLTRTQYISTFNGAQANFVGSPTTGLYPLTVTFTNTSLYANQFVWDYGDGITSTTTAITHTHDYLSAGSYTVSLKATNVFNSSTLTRPNYITTSGLVIAWFDASPTSGAAPLLVHFDNKSINATNSTWIFGDGTINIGSFSPYHFYWYDGSYTVTLSVSNGILSDSLTRPAYITVGTLKHYLFFPLIKR